MIVWVDRRLERWGLWIRGDIAIGYGESPIARMMRGQVEQNGKGATVTVVQVDESEALATDAAIARLPKPLPQLMRCWYGTQLPAKIIAKRFRRCRATVYRWRDISHEMLSYQLQKH